MPYEPEPQPMTVDEFNEATRGFYELLHRRYRAQT